jgi:hypothetical protein
MKQPDRTYTDTSRVSVYLISCSDAKPIIVNNHYSHKWTSCRFAYGIYYDGKIIGCVVYGPPVGRQVTTSITKTIQFKRDEILELTRLWIADGYGTNIESYCIGQTFKYLRELGIRVLISYADPNVGHLGKIYQATNWLYQGDRTMLVKPCKLTVNGETLHYRTAVARYGSVKDNVLKEIDPHYTREESLRKHRYLYILNKRERQAIIDDLKHPIKEYVKND